MRSTTDAIAEDLSSAYQGNVDGRLKHEVDIWLTTMSRSARAYLGALNAARFDNEARGLVAASDTASLDALYGRAVGDALFAWNSAEIELVRMLRAK